VVQIYSDFSSEIRWIVERIQEETLNFPNSLKPLAEHYTSKRAYILSTDEDRIIRLDPKLGLPTRNCIPHVVFWLADAFGLKDRNITKRLALGLVYSSLSFAVLDDTIEQETQSTSSNLALANMYLHKYLKSFDSLFEPDLKFWHYLTTSIKDFNLLVYQDFTFKNEPQDIATLDPLSEPFLFESCKSYSMLVMTTLTAVAYATNNETKIPLLTKFWNDYAMGHRIYDDLNDVQMDLRMDDYNNSSVLLYALQKADTKLKLDEELVWSMLLDAEFIEKIYGTMLGLFNRAREEASALNCPSLIKFMDGLISSHTQKRDGLLKTGSDFYKELGRILTK
jgi:hypothetical protein